MRHMRFGSLGSIGFLLALGVIVLMYLLKRKYVDTVVPSHLLWDRVLRNLEANRPWQKLRNRLLFWLQMLVAALLVLALMQPFIPAASSAKSHLVLVADTSASMSAADAQNAQGETVTRLEQMKERMRELVSLIGKYSEITLIRMGEQPELLESRQTSIEKLEQSIDALEIFYGKTAYRETMSLAASLTRTEQDAEIIVFTDQQWPEPPAGITYSVPVRTETIQGTDRNVSIAQFGVKLTGGDGYGDGYGGGGGGRSAENSGVQGVAVIRNWSSEPKTVEVLLGSDENHRVLDIRTVELGPEEQKTVRYDQLDLAAYYTLQLNTSEGLKADKYAYAMLAEQGPRRALLLSQGNLFLEKALQLSGVEVIRVQIPADEGEEGLSQREVLTIPDAKVDFIVLDGVADEWIASPAWSELLEQKPYWKIMSVDRQDQTAQPIDDSYEISDHPITQYIRMADVHIAQLAKTETIPWGEPIVKIGGVPAVIAGTEQGRARLLFAFDLHHSDLPLRAEFPILVRNSVDWLGSERTVSLGRVGAGSTLEIPVSPAASRAEWQPLGGLVTAEGDGAELLQTSGESVELSAFQRMPDIPGLYRMVQYDESGAEVAALLAEVTMDPAESNLASRLELDFMISEVTMNSPVGDASQNRAESMPAGGISLAGGMSLVPWIVLLVGLLMLLEWGVYQRGDSV